IELTGHRDIESTIAKASKIFTLFQFVTLNERSPGKAPKAPWPCGSHQESFFVSALSRHRQEHQAARLRHLSAAGAKTRHRQACHRSPRSRSLAATSQGSQAALSYRRFSHVEWQHRLLRLSTRVPRA